MKHLNVLLLSAAWALSSGPQASAVTISLSPNSQSIGVGGTASFDLLISGLGDHASPSLSGFDLDLLFDPTVLSAPLVVFGNYLDRGNAFVLGVSGSEKLVTPSFGLISLHDLSMESPGDLNTSQPDTFRLATLTFTGLALGTSPLDFSYAALSDENGVDLTGFTLSSGSVTVNSGGVPVPDLPSTGALLLMGLLGLPAMGCRWRALVRNARP